MSAKISLSLTDEQESYARSLVESGQFPSLGAVLRRDNERHGAEIEALRSLIDQRRAGEFIDLDK